MGGWTGEDETTFLNVDLDIRSRAPLEPLAAAFGEQVGVHYVGPEGTAHGAHFDLADSHQKDADTLLRDFVRLVRKLRGPARKLWQQARSRDFNIGIQAGIRPHAYELALAPDTIRSVARVGGRLVITVYASYKPRRQAARVPKSPPGAGRKRR
jgi:hypothetical protein